MAHQYELELKKAIIAQVSATALSSPIELDHRAQLGWRAQDPASDLMVSRQGEFNSINHKLLLGELGNGAFRNHDLGKVP
jgi:hypothetical protein